MVAAAWSLRRREKVEAGVQLRRGDARELVGEGLGCAIQGCVEAVDVGLSEDADADPLAAGAAQRQLAMERSGLAACEWLHEICAAGGAHVQVA